MLKSMPETLKEMRDFLNKKTLPALHVGYFLGRPRGTPLFGSMRVTPFDKRFTMITSAAIPRRPNVLSYVSFACEAQPINLTDLITAFGEFAAEFEEKGNLTKLVWSQFEESELIETVFTTIEGYRMENDPGGLRLYQPDGGTVVVPLTEMQIPGFTFTFKEFERPEDKKGINPVIGR